LEPFLQPLIDARDAKIYAIPPRTNTTLAVKDDKLLAVLFRSKNGADYQRLWDGDLSVCGGDHSKCDQYLCDGLAWVTGRDTGRMDQLFRMSGLYRDKWNRDDYRKVTLDKAANSAYTDYDPFRGLDPSAIAAVEAMMKNE
jgi:primase-polymerase (primpol)-like protein